MAVYYYDPVTRFFTLQGSAISILCKIESYIVPAFKIPDFATEVHPPSIIPPTQGAYWNGTSWELRPL